MPTNDEIEALKNNWRRDPVWDIETTPGFEEHKAQLHEYRLEHERLTEEQDAANLRQYANAIGLSTNLQLAKFIWRLAERVDELEFIVKTNGLA
jgi:hypothetical protein